MPIRHSHTKLIAYPVAYNKMSSTSYRAKASHNADYYELTRGVHIPLLAPQWTSSPTRPLNHTHRKTAASRMTGLRLELFHCFRYSTQEMIRCPILIFSWRIALTCCNIFSNVVTCDVKITTNCMLLQRKIIIEISIYNLCLDNQLPSGFILLYF